ncbi:MAG: tetratricopeptide repeat protein [Adhaeribacter sp.]
MMKKSYILNAVLIVIIVAAVGLFYHYRNVQDPIPPLKERTGPISVTSEWLNTKAAIQGLQRKLREKPNDLQSKLLLAFAFMQEARITGEHPYYYPAALNLINDILDQEPENPILVYEATVAKASIQLSLHQFNEALATGKKALAINPNIASVYGVLCDANVELGNYEEAINMADRMTAIRPDLKSYSRISYLREIHGDLPGAIEAMEHAAAAGYPGLEQTAWTRFNLGSLYEKTGDLQKAAAVYERAMAEYPKYAFAIGGLARLAEKKNNPQDAIRLYTEAANVLPEFSFQEELVRLYQRQGETRTAANLMEELIEGLKEDQKSGHLMDLELANIYLHLKNDPKTAMTYAIKEFKRRPNNIDVCKTLAAIYYKQQQYQQADFFLQKATRTNSQDPTLLCLNGLVKYRLGDRVAGETLIRKSLATDPFQHTTYSTEGRSLLSNSVTKL